MVDGGGAVRPTGCEDTVAVVAVWVGALGYGEDDEVAREVGAVR